MQSTLKSRAVLMRLTIGLPGENRQDNNLTAEVKSEKKLGSHAGKWIKALYPPVALECIKKLDNEARSYHAAVTLPFDSGVGILPTALIFEYAQRMKAFASMREELVKTHFLARYDEWVDWAKLNHNGTFDASQYPGKDEIAEKFYFKTQPVPVPDSTHFENNVASLLGVDTESVTKQVADAALEAQRTLLKRMLEPVAHMAKTLAKESPRIFDSLIGNVKEIAELAPKLNLAGDAVIDGFAAEMDKLTRFSADSLRDSEATRDEAKKAAESMLAKLSGYKI